MHKQNIYFPYLLSNKYLINSLDSFDKNLNAKSVYLFLSMYCFLKLSPLFLFPFLFLKTSKQF